MAWGRAGAASEIDDLLKRISENDPKLQSLTILRFRRLNDADVEALSKALQGSSSLQELTCSSHSISAAASSALGAMLQHNRALKRISIGNSSWGDQAAAALAQGLKHNTVLESWDLEHKGLTSAAAGCIVDVLQAHPALQQLSLSRNALGDAGLSQLCASPWKGLQHLQLSGCGLTAEGLKALASAASLDQLTHLDLSHNQLGPAAAQSLQQLLSAAARLQSLVLRNTAVGGTGVGGLAKGLSDSSRPLNHLDLSCTQLDDAGLAALAAALAGSKQQLQAAAPGAQPLLQQQLLLGGNPDLSDAAISKLAAGLSTAAAGAPKDSSTAGSEARQQQQQQWHLDLAETGAGAEAVQALAELPGLQQLSLFGCKLGAAADGADAPIKALQACLTTGGFSDLQGLNLSGCALSYDQLQSLLQQLSSSSANTSSGKGLAGALKTLEVGANPGTQHDEFEGLVQQLREARPGLDVHWRVADSDAPPPTEQQQGG